MGVLEYAQCILWLDGTELGFHFICFSLCILHMLLVVWFHVCSGFYVVFCLVMSIIVDIIEVTG